MSCRRSSVGCAPRKLLQNCELRLSAQHAGLIAIRIYITMSAAIHSFIWISDAVVDDSRRFLFSLLPLPRMCRLLHRQLQMVLSSSWNMKLLLPYTGCARVSQAPSPKRSRQAILIISTLLILFHVMASPATAIAVKFELS